MLYYLVQSEMKYTDGEKKTPVQIFFSMKGKTFRVLHRYPNGSAVVEMSEKLDSGYIQELQETDAVITTHLEWSKKVPKDKEDEQYGE